MLGTLLRAPLSCGCRGFSSYGYQLTKFPSAKLPALMTGTRLAVKNTILTPLRTCTTAAPAAPAGALKQVPGYANKYVGAWLLGCSGMVFGAVILGIIIYLY